MFLSKKAHHILIENTIFIQENIFNPKYYTKGFKEKFKNFEQDLKKIIEKEKQEILKYLNKSFYKKYNLKPFYDAFKDEKEFLKALEILKENKIISDKKYKTFKVILKHKAKMNPCTFGIQSSKKDEKGAIFLIVIPEPKTFFNVPFYNYFTNIFTKKELKRIYYYIAYAHELFEVSEGLKVYWNNQSTNGELFIKRNNNFYQVGNHYTILVLAKEALILNNFYKEFKEIKIMRDFRKLEWKIIKHYTDVDFSEIKTVEDYLKVEKKLRKIKPDVYKKILNTEQRIYQEIEGLILDYKKLPKIKINNILIKHPLFKEIGINEKDIKSIFDFK